MAREPVRTCKEQKSHPADPRNRAAAPAQLQQAVAPRGQLPQGRALVRGRGAQPRALHDLQVCLWPPRRVLCACIGAHHVKVCCGMR